jgi:hypothetical protein
MSILDNLEAFLEYEDKLNQENTKAYIPGELSAGNGKQPTITPEVTPNSNKKL